MYKKVIYVIYQQFPFYDLSKKSIMVFLVCKSTIWQPGNYTTAMLSELTYTTSNVNDDICTYVNVIICIMTQRSLNIQKGSISRPSNTTISIYDTQIYHLATLNYTFAISTMVEWDFIHGQHFCF
jgi:hypothetical protein